jgi:hypothetical protein
MLKRGGIDPIRIDRRALSEILNDEIPYARWAKEQSRLERAGYAGWRDFLNKRKPPWD